MKSNELLVARNSLLSRHLCPFLSCFHDSINYTNMLLWWHVVLSAESDVVDFKVVWNKKTYDVSLSLNEKVLKLKHHMQSLVGMFNRCEVCICVQASITFM